jgi:hypothetical protein
MRSCSLVQAVFLDAAFCCLAPAPLILRKRLLIALCDGFTVVVHIAEALQIWAIEAKFRPLADRNDVVHLVRCAIIPTFGNAFATQRLFFPDAFTHPFPRCVVTAGRCRAAPLRFRKLVRGALAAFDAFWATGMPAWS